MSRAARFAAIATFAVLGCAGCGDDGSPSADPTASAPTSEATTTSATPSPVPAYLEGFSAEERQAYDDAVQAYEAFSDQQATFMAAGKATAEAKRFYRRQTADWRTFWATLQQRESNGVRIKGAGETLRIRPAKIRLHDDGTGSVSLNVCGISSGVRVLQNGTPVPQPKPVPRIVRVGMVSLDTGPRWLVLYERVGPKC
jgi:hypothetical protein